MAKIKAIEKIGCVGQELRDELVHLIDEDTIAFNNIMLAFKLSKKTPEEKSKRIIEIEKATIYAIEIPLKVMELSCLCSSKFVTRL